ncbi:MAG: gliding motility protein GldM [Bacteroidetes bacterium]|nr:gliding motility protein GldM [Bacteroidota bacterium]
MGHGKETPRQKMIGMMYLVLTAMLALNVSAEVLDAFDTVDKGLVKTTEIYTQKNEGLYQEFNQQYAQNQQKVGPWKEKADEVKRRSDELINYIQDIKIEIITANGQGDPEEGVIGEEGKIHGDHIKGKDKSDVATNIMIGEHDGKAFELRKKIEEYREFMLGLVDEDNQSLIHSITTNLDTSDPPKTDDGEKKDWETKNFYGLPLAAVFPILTKMQLDIRNSEAEVVQYLFNQISAGSIPFNKLEATVIPNTSYVLQGNEYKADVFIAAFDTTAAPIVLIGEYDSTYNEETGSYEYDMVGRYDSLDVVNGRGKFSRMGQSLGTQKWGGIIRLKDPDGNYITKTFERTYNVAKANVVVSPDKMNVFYVGVDNPVSISIAGVDGDKISPSITNGRIKPVSAGKYIVNPKRPGNSLVTVFAEIDGVQKNMGTAPFRVKGLPDPVVQVAGKKGGKIERNVLAAQTGVFAVMEDFDFDLEFKIIEFTVSTTDRGGYYISESTKGNIFTPSQKGLIKNLRRGQRLNIEDVKAIGPDGSVRPLAPIVFELI